MKYVPKRGGAPWTLRTLRDQAFHAQGGLCYWCQQPMNHLKDDPLRLTADHLVPRYAQGLTKPGNVVAACAKCNSSRNSEVYLPKAKHAQWQSGDETPHSPFEQLKGLIRE